MRLFWDDERTNEAAKLWSEGRSAEQIARQIGAASRNAVIGRLHRLGLNGPKPNLEPRNRPPRSFKVAAPKPVSAAKTVFKPRAEPLPVAQELEIPLAERKTIDTLENHHCRWPIGDPLEADFHYCGKNKIPGKSYCEHHTHRASVPGAPAQRGGFVVRKGRMLQQLTSPSVDPRTLEDA